MDYEKLKLTHELAYKYSADKDEIIQICLDFQPRREPTIILLEYQTNDWNELARGENPVIEKLQELTQPKCKCGKILGKARSVCNECIEMAVKSYHRKPKYEVPKYEVGEEVWLMLFGELSECKVEEIYWDNDLNDYRLSLIKPYGKASVGQSHVYPSRESLIESQIEYWTGMKQEQIIPVNDIGRKNDDLSTHSDDMSITSFEGEIKGFNQSENKLEKVLIKGEPGYTLTVNQDGTITRTKINKLICSHPDFNYTSIYTDNKTIIQKRCSMCREIINTFGECDHEIYTGPYPRSNPPNKCKKCGEFYR